MLVVARQMTHGSWQAWVEGRTEVGDGWRGAEGGDVNKGRHSKHTAIQSRSASSFFFFLIGHGADERQSLG